MSTTEEDDDDHLRIKDEWCSLDQEDHGEVWGMNLSKEEINRLDTMLEWSTRAGVTVGTRLTCIDALYAEYERLKLSVTDWREPKYDTIEFQWILELVMTWEFGSKKLDVILFYVPGSAVDVTYELKQDEIMLSKGLLADSFATYWKWLWEVGEG